MNGHDYITDTYRRQQFELHMREPSYGSACLAYVPDIVQIIRGRRVTTMIDYGAGKGRLAEALLPKLDPPFELTCYDPGFPKFSDLPEKPAQLVTCIDVLEHVEPDLTENVISHIKSLVAPDGVAFITIGMTPARKVLDDGRNAHINLRRKFQWLDLFDLHGFTPMKMNMAQGGHTLTLLLGVT